MGIDIKLDDTYDLAMENGDLVLVSDAPEVVQAAGIRLLFMQSEWFFDFTAGVPWFQNIFTHETSYEQKAKVLKDTIRNTPGVNRLISFEFGIDPVAHVATVEFTAETIFGNVELKVGV
jgi:hypothetical protein